METTRLMHLYSLARSQGVSKTKKQFAEQIGASYTTFVRTLNGEKYYSPERSILAAENMLRARGIDPNADVVTLNSIMKELKEQRELIEKVLHLVEKGHNADTRNKK